MTHIRLGARGDDARIRLFPFINGHPPSDTLRLVLGRGWGLGGMTGQHLTFGARPQDLSDNVGTDTFLVLLYKNVFVSVEVLNIGRTKASTACSDGVGEGLTIAAESCLKGC